MKTDIYTKTMLTVIALALVALFFKKGDIIEQARAVTPPNNARGYVNVPVNADGSINVRFSPNTEMEVNILSVSPNAYRYSTLPVEIKSFDYNAFNNTHVPVKLQSVDYSAFSNCYVPVTIKKNEDK